MTGNPLGKAAVKSRVLPEIDSLWSFTSIMQFVDMFLVIAELPEDAAAAVIWCGEGRNDKMIDSTLSLRGRGGWLKANCNIAAKPERSR